MYGLVQKPLESSLSVGCKMFPRGKIYYMKYDQPNITICSQTVFLLYISLSISIDSKIRKIFTGVVITPSVVGRRKRLEAIG